MSRGDKLGPAGKKFKEHLYNFVAEGKKLNFVYAGDV
jgi:hypothetical protein